MGKKICPNCNNEFKDSRKQRMERGSIMRALKMIKVIGISEKHEETKKFCHDCWKTELRSVMKPFAQMLGKAADGW